MEIIQFKHTLAFSLVLASLNSHAAPLSPYINNKDNLQIKTSSKSCVAVESESSKKQRLQRGEENIDLFVQLDSFSSYKKGWEEKMNNLPLEDTMLYAFTAMGIVAVELKTTFTPMLLGLCNKEMASKNQCNYEMPSAEGGQMIIETQWTNATQYTMTQSIMASGTKIKKMTVSSELPNYWNGAMTLYDEDGSKSESSWSRTPDGTEHYHTESVNAAEYSSITFTELPNCSADIIYVKGDIKITANWHLSGEKTTGKFTNCNLNDCDNGNW